MMNNRCASTPIPEPLPAIEIGEGKYMKTFAVCEEISNTSNEVHVDNILAYIQMIIFAESVRAFLEDANLSEEKQRVDDDVEHLHETIEKKANAMSTV